MKKLFALFFVLFAAGCGVSGMDDYNKGVEYQQQKQTELAEQQFKLAIQSNPDLAEAHLNMGMIYLERGWLEGGENSTRKAIEIFERTKMTYVKGSDYKQSLSVAYNNMGVIEIQKDLQAEAAFNMPVAKEHYLKAMDYFN